MKELEVLIEEYAALVWRTVAAYLKNPEDIKECVNDTFLEFYLHKDRYDPDKGSYSAFLSGIARNKAISRYRKIHPEESYRTSLSEENAELASDTNLEETVTDRLDLASALDTLKPEEFDIIRMKYYDGMTIKEIADSLKLPYETVKKRHQRSLTKLQRALTLGLILALIAALAACAYVVLRHFGIIPGYGTNLDPDTSFYVLEESVSAENEEFGIEIENALWGSGSVKLYITLWQKEGWTPKNEESSWHNALTSEISLEISGIHVDKGSTSVIKNSPKEGVYSFVLSFQLPEKVSEDGRTEEVRPEDITFRIPDFVLELSLKPTEELSTEQFPYEMSDLGGVLIDPFFENGRLMIDLYPLSLEPFTLSIPYFNDGEITVTGEDGTVYPGTPLLNASFMVDSGSILSRYDFGEAGPGNYTLRFPNVALVTSLPEDFFISFEGDTVLQTDSFAFPGGSVIPGTPTYKHPNPVLPPPLAGAQRNTLYLPLTPVLNRADLTLEYLVVSPTQISDPSAFVLSGCRSISLRQPDGSLGFWGLGLELPEDIPLEDLRYGKGSFAPLEDSVSLLWHHPFCISFTVED